ncbi:MAG: hypothetical protein M1833_000703 [Piccolia ochrophora]|nr:MAG: hypothetical protein M1833_000703 [Piccolia ochrophora]
MQDPTPSADSTSSLMSRKRNSAYVRSGIGGAGNYQKSDPVAAQASKAPQPPLPRHHSSFTSGIGGAGNYHHANEAASMSSAEELARGRVREVHQPEVFHFGIGGAGNRTGRNGSRTSRSDSSFESQGPSFQSYSDKRLRVGAADRLADKLANAFGRRK